MTLNIGQAQVVVDLDGSNNQPRGLQGGNRNNIQSMPPGALKPSDSDMRHYDERQQAAQPAVEQQVFGKMAMREESMEDLNNMNAVQQHLDVPINGGKLLSSSSRPALDDNGKPVLRVQRT